MTKAKRRIIEDKDTKKKKKKKTSELLDLNTINFANKYRPKNIEDFIGQEHIHKQYRGWLKTKTFPSVVLISGHLGSGKTTFGNIIGKTVNCDTLNACGECPSCKAFDSGFHPDILTYDMGNDSGKVEGSQRIIESSTLSPMYRRRVYILDEAHLMTSQAESKFLIPLENPAPHTIWVLISTDPQKIKSTILSRCVKLPINPIDPDVIAERIEFIAKAEKILPKDKKELKEARAAIRTIAEYSGGQLRGAIGLFQTVYSAVKGGEEFNTDLVLDMAASDPEINLGDMAVDFITGYLKMDLIEIIRTVRNAADIRGLLHKSRWLLHYILGDIAKTNKFQTAELRKFNDNRKKAKFNIEPIAIIYLQKALCDIELAINSSSIPVEVMFESTITGLMSDIYSGKLSIKLK
ncbi:putative DNA ploymerase III [Dickeya phage vB_DsoM_JA33]|uniref:Putative DNA polymerase III n=3 Tax=Salmondvirus JA11 TaxID=2734141 RepID=A0A384ZWI7_9CAUD|nr:clamp loader of DNA polymerase [Dickeya phage vB_DsoM_JA11]AXG66595.1 putative DNA polymerase III [Dickeya phage vB_DsoM_JA13]AXG67566.1 putative DNA ploymerase III [Dickeya phage vB_DsoM_JA33]AYD79997.1 putative DNA polymerase III [Dickeya phage vB_DsoM_JA11]